MNSEEFIHWCKASPDERDQCNPLIMGILNITPDSFFDGGCYLGLDDAKRQVNQLLQEDADIIDVGGESSRPGALSISESEEMDRVIPIIEYIRSLSPIAVSIDTVKPNVMRAAISAGATFVNDISALNTPEAVKLVAELQVPVCLMHMQGTPQKMQQSPFYSEGVVSVIKNFFSERIEMCLQTGILPYHLILDPGFGFGKTNQHNLLLTHFLSEFKSFNLPILFGASRKSTIGALLNRTVEERLYGSLGLAVSAALKGANIIRTHDVAATKDIINMVYLVENAVNQGDDE